jgi:cellulose synthase/poly-beta-1,6-N-acetylglucosamine synthase-like glycosyltransferase
MCLSKVLVGICAYNEENNIGSNLHNLILEQDLPKNCRIVVVCSGCTDRTPRIVKDFQKRDTRIEPIIEKVRKGKANALNKIFEIARESADVLVLVNADTLPKRGSITKLISRLENNDAGAVYAQPVPFKEFDGFCRRIERVIWRLHHIISLRKPKLSGELCAIRTSCLQKIPENVATDEPYIELAIRKQGYDILYMPEAFVYIRCPANVVDLLKHRKRIWAGHMQLQNATGVKVSTSSFWNILQGIPALRPTEIFYALLGGFLEVVAYFQARVTLSEGKVPYIWEPIKSTKSFNLNK